VEAATDAARERRERERDMTKPERREYTAATGRRRK